MQPVVWLIAGTSEGRQLAEALTKMNVQVYASVATEYGASLLTPHHNLRVMDKRMTYEDMVEFIELHRPELVVDATHPYATIVTETVQRACANHNCQYMRVVRPQGDYDHCLRVNSFEEAVELLSHVEGFIFLTTGSKNLADFAKLPNFAERVACRVLPMRDSLDKALSLGYKTGNIICMQGPFSEELNVAMFKRYKAKFVVTKDSGAVGGFEEKLTAVEKAGAKLVVIARSQEDGAGLTEALDKLKQRFTEK